MKYMGSKRRIAKQIIPVMLLRRKPGQYYVEPFVGGGNMIDKVTLKRIGADLNPYLIAALELIRDDPKSLPKNNKEFTREDWEEIKNNKDSNPGLAGYCGFALSYGGDWFSSFAKYDNDRDYILESYKNTQNQSKFLQGVDFVVSDYSSLQIPENSIIYCDPPYQNTSTYKAVDQFDHEKFWEWCREKTSQGHEVYISEYSAPEDFKCVWKKNIKCAMALRKKANQTTEKLFVYKG